MHKSNETTRETRERKSEKMAMKWKEVTLGPLLKERLKTRHVCSLSMVSMSDVLSLQIDFTSSKPSVLPNNFRLGLEMAIASIQKCGIMTAQTPGFL